MTIVGPGFLLHPGNPVVRTIIAAGGGGAFRVEWRRPVRPVRPGSDRPDSAATNVKGAFVKVEVKEVEELVRELAIEVEPAQVTEKMESKFAEVRRSVTLKGFRKGHAPMDVIKRMYADEVKSDVLEEIMKATYPQAVREKELHVAAAPEITAFNLTDDGGLAYTARVEVMPKIETVSYDNLEITTVDIDVKDEEVEQASKQVQKSFAEQRVVTREIRENDIVVADLKKTYDPQNAIQDDYFADALIDLSNPVTVKEFREQLPGLKTGDSKEIEVKYDDDYSDKAFAGATIKYEATVKEVREEIVPNFDDHLAKSTGQAETALELKLRIRDDLRHQKEDELRRLNKNEVIGQICENNKVPVPNGLVNEYLDAMVEDVKKNNPEVDEAQVRSSYQGVATTTLRWNLLYNHIAETENIQVLKEDTDKVIKRFAENYRISEEQAAQALHRSGKTSSIRDTLIEEKVLDFLIGKAKVVKRTPDETVTKD